MLELSTAKIVRKAINKHLGAEQVSLNAVCKMQPVMQGTTCDDFNILALQYSYYTILVWIEFNEKLGVIVRDVQTIAW